MSLNENEAANWTLEQQEAESRRIIEEVLHRFGPDKVATTWTGGKDSTTLLHMLRQAGGGKVPVRVLKFVSSTFKVRRSALAARSNCTVDIRNK